MMLLLDLGNSRLKWALADAQIVQRAARAWDAADMTAGLERDWQALTRPTRVVAASVTTPERVKAVDALLARLAWPSATWLRSPARCGPLQNAYRHPADLGIDRFLGMLAALDAGLAPCVLASVGSALTLDAVDADGQHLGGQIVPGLGAMRSALRRAAPGLPDPGPGPQPVFAHGTAAAMRAGATQALAGAIERFAGQTETALRTRPRLLLCGGDAGPIGALLTSDWTMLEQAVLRGLLVWARLNPPA